MSFPPKKPWNRQPPYWVPADPRWGATSVWNGLYPLIDGVDGKPFTISGTMPALDGTILGAAPLSLSGVYFQRSDITNTGPAFSVIAIFRPLSTDSYNTILGNGSAGGGKGWKVAADYNGSSSWKQQATFGGVADYDIQIPTWTNIGQARVCGFRVTGNGGTFSAFHNGALIGSTAVGTMLTPPGSPLTIGASYAGSYGASCLATMPMVAFWNRALPDAQMRELTENPWAIYNPRRVIVPGAAIVGSPAAPAFKSAWARNSNTVIQAAIQ